MKKILVLLYILGQMGQIQAQELAIYPGLPDNKLKSSKYSVSVRMIGDTLEDSYVYEYIKNVGTNATTNDPYNISNAGKRDALTNSNHWTCFSFGGGEVEVEITKASGDISSCKVFPGRYGIEATITGGKAYITLPAPNKKIYLEIDGDVKQPLFIFADPLETNIPSADDPAVDYYGPGIHNIGINYTPAAGIKTVYIAGGAYVVGNIYTNNRDDLTIRGRGIISGEGIKFNVNSRSDGHIYFDGSGSENCVIEGITIIKPIKYHVLSRGQFDVDNIKCISWNNTTDGWGGGYGSGKPCTCTNSFFKVNDDVWKLYGDNFTISDNVVYHQTNGHVFQFGWGGQESKNSKIDRIDIVRCSETEPSYPTSEGHPIIGWASANAGKVQSGHIFNDITAENGISRLFDIDGQGIVNIECNDFVISRTVKKSLLSGSISIALNCVEIDGETVTYSEFDRATGITILDCQGGSVSNASSSRNSSLRVFPNPAADYIKITGSDAGSNYRIYDVEGRLILRSSEPLITVSTLEPGMYFLQNTEEILKFIKQ